MATLKKYREHSQFTGPDEILEIQYDFAVDGGATGALDVFKVDVDMVLLNAFMKVDTACTSGGSATVIYGVKGGTTNLCMTTTEGAVANLTVGAVIPGDAACKQVKLPSGTVLSMTIGTAALTAGKFRMCFIMQRF